MNTTRQIAAIVILLATHHALSQPAVAPPGDSLTAVVSAANKGRVVTARGWVTGVVSSRNFTQPHRAVIADGRGGFAIVTYSQSSDVALRIQPGDDVVVTGIVMEEEGAVRIAVGAESSISIVGRGAVPAGLLAPSDPLGPSQVEARFLGQVITVRGWALSSKVPVSSSMAFVVTLGDDRGNSLVAGWTKRVVELLRPTQRFATGDELLVTGHLVWDEDRLVVEVDEASDLVVLGRGTAPGQVAGPVLNIGPGDIGRELLGKKVTVRGWVCGVDWDTDGSRPNWVALIDARGAAGQILFVKEVADAFRPSQSFALGDELLCTGTVIEVGTTYYLQILSAADIAVAGRQNRPPIEIARTPPLRFQDVGPHLVGTRITVRGWVENVFRTSRPSTPSTMILVDGKGVTFRVVFWPLVMDRLTGDLALQAGDEVLLSGPLALYEGSLQLQLRAADEVSIVGRATRPEGEADESGILSPSAVKEGHLGQRMTIRGWVTRLQRGDERSRPVVLTLCDETMIPCEVVYWFDVASALRQSQQPEIGDEVVVSGWVQKHLANLQLRLSDPADIMVSRRQAAPPALRSGLVEPAAGAGDNAPTTPRRAMLGENIGVGDEIEIRLNLRDNKGRPLVHAVFVTGKIILVGNSKLEDYGRLARVRITDNTPTFFRATIVEYLD